MGTAKQRQETGKTAYELRDKYGYTWAVIANQLPGKPHNIRKAAEEHAARQALKWPLDVYSRGRMLWEMMRDGWTLREIRSETQLEIYHARKYARDYARRRGRPWPAK